jgi:hypothetical protein
MKEIAKNNLEEHIKSRYPRDKGKDIDKGGNALIK